MPSRHLRGPDHLPLRPWPIGLCHVQNLASSTVSWAVCQLSPASVRACLTDGCRDFRAGVNHKLREGDGLRCPGRALLDGLVLGVSLNPQVRKLGREGQGRRHLVAVLQATRVDRSTCANLACCLIGLLVADSASVQCLLGLCRGLLWPGSGFALHGRRDRLPRNSWTSALRASSACALASAVSASAWACTASASACAAADSSACALDSAVSASAWACTASASACAAADSSSCASCRLGVGVGGQRRLGIGLRGSSSAWALSVPSRHRRGPARHRSRPIRPRCSYCRSGSLSSSSPAPWKS